MEEREKVRIENVELLCPEYSCLGWASPGVIIVTMKVDQIMTNRNDILCTIENNDNDNSEDN